MTTFETANLSLGPREHMNDTTTPTTPRAPFESIPRLEHSQPRDGPESTTPTRSSFATSNGKRALPSSPRDSTFPSIEESPSSNRNSGLFPGDSRRSSKSLASEDVEMGEIGDSEEEEEGSDTESGEDGTERPSKKKKKGQRFFCTEYPPCNLSFTRSEHLARHIRKHTGERPFQCHCGRRFSRLDNLRQHAQTVHVNEDIPGDSLAATGTRFQRQIRTDRIRPQGGRARAGTGGSQSGPHGRGHSRNLSTSSITSTASTMSTISNVSTISRENSGRRPSSLILNDQSSPRARLTIDTLRASPQATYAYNTESPGTATTPTSTTFGNNPSSPFASTVGSPVSVSRNIGYWGDRTPGRRLSVPTGANPFQVQYGTPHSAHYQNLLIPSNSSHSSTNTSLVSSPTSSVYSFTRHEPSQSGLAAEMESRRRTWHPSTYSNYVYQRPATSGLSFYQTPDAPRPAFAPNAAAAASQPHRLPGIETFDQISQRPVTPVRPNTDSTQPETPNRPSLYSASSDRGIPGPDDRRSHLSWDMSLHQGLTRLELASGTPPKEPSPWAKQAVADIQNVPSASNQPHQPQQQIQQQPQDQTRQQVQQQVHPQIYHPAQRHVQQPQQQPPPQIHQQIYERPHQQPYHQQQQQQPPQPQPQHQSNLVIFQEGQKPSLGQGQQPQASQPPQQPQSDTAQRSKRNGWYNGPIIPSRHAFLAQRPSPEDSSSSDGVPTPSSTSLDYQPSIVHANGYIEPQRVAPVTSNFMNFSHPRTHNHVLPVVHDVSRTPHVPKQPDLSALEALCAVATSEKVQNTVAHQ